MSTGVPLLAGAGALPEQLMRSASTAWPIAGTTPPATSAKANRRRKRCRKSAQTVLIRFCGDVARQQQEGQLAWTPWRIGVVNAAAGRRGAWAVTLLAQRRPTPPSAINSVRPSSGWSRSDHNGTDCNAAGMVCPGAVGFLQQPSRPRPRPRSSGAGTCGEARSQPGPKRWLTGLDLTQHLLAGPLGQRQLLNVHR